MPKVAPPRLNSVIDSGITRIPFPAQPLRQRKQAALNGAGPHNNAKRATDYQHKGDHIGCFNDAF